MGTRSLLLHSTREYCPVDVHFTLNPMVYRSPVFMYAMGHSITETQLITNILQFPDFYAGAHLQVCEKCALEGARAAGMTKLCFLLPSHGGTAKMLPVVVWLQTSSLQLCEASKTLKMLLYTSAPPVGFISAAFPMCSWLNRSIQQMGSVWVGFVCCFSLGKNNLGMPPVSFRNRLFVEDNSTSLVLILIIS